MVKFIIENISTILIIAALLGFIALACVKIIKDKKKGAGCNCGCGGCGKCHE